MVYVPRASGNGMHSVVVSCKCRQFPWVDGVPGSLLSPAYTSQSLRRGCRCFQLQLWVRPFLPLSASTSHHGCRVHSHSGLLGLREDGPFCHDIASSSVSVIFFALMSTLSYRNATPSAFMGWRFVSDVIPILPLSANIVIIKVSCL